MKTHSRNGVTLLELLIVLTLIASLMGIGVGIFGQLNLGQQAAVGVVKNILRSTRSSALISSVPARVVINQKENTLKSLSLRPIGMWHFESMNGEGAFGITALMNHMDLESSGRFGSCARFSNSDEQYIQLPVGGLASYNTKEGIGCEFDLRMDQLSASTLIERKGSFAISITSDGRIKGEVFLVGTLTQGGGRNILETRESVLQPGRWQHVFFLYDRKKMRIFVDGVEEAAVEETAPLQAPPEPILIGGSHLGFYGCLDELKISAVSAGELVTMPKGVAIAAAPGEIQFDAAGNLDPTMHGDSVSIGLQYENGKKAKIEIGIYGTIR